MSLQEMTQITLKKVIIIATRITGGVDYRAKNIESFDSLENNSIDFYASIRSLYLQDRQQKILNSKKITDTMDDSDWEEIESN